jgi:HK97 family phage major capsid protein/HK97 family phage prohead protease
MELTFSGHITAADSGRRELIGQIVPFGKPGNTSAGLVVFDVGSIVNLEASGIKLLREHDHTAPVGKAIEFSANPGGIIGRFKVSNTSLGNDILIEAAEGLREGFSIGAKILDYKYKGEVMHISAAQIIEVSVVTMPAFGLEHAMITDVAASESPEVETPEDKETTVTEEVTPVEVEAAEAPVVEAAAPVKTPIFTSPRVAPLTAAALVEHTLKAHFGNVESQDYLRAANNTTANPGLVPTPVMNEIIDSSNATRSTIDAISRGALPPVGMSFEIPIVDTYPTVDVVDEGDTIPASELAIDKISVDVVGFKGRATGITWELIERSSPAFMTELVAHMGKALAKEQDTYVLSRLVSAGTVAGTHAATAEGFQNFLAVESAAVYSATADFADNVIGNTAWWSEIQKFRDTTGRALYNAQNPQNNSGSVSNALRGNVNGFNFYVDPNFAVTTTADNSLLLVNSSAATFYEGGVTQLRVNNLADGTVELALYSPGALAIKKAAGIRKWNLS